MRTLTSFFFLATLACCTFERVNWNLAGSVNISEILSAFFLLSYLILMRPRVPHTTVVILGFFAAFVLVYLVGFFNLETKQALDQFIKGFVTTVHHWAFLTIGVAWIWHCGRTYYWRALAWFVGGMVVNSLYGVVDLLVARSGGDLDASVLTPITGGADKINLYGKVQGASVYRTTAMTGDPNHLAIFLIVPLLVLTPLYLRLERRHRLKKRLAVLIAFLLLVEVSTLSRSGLLGLGAGALVLAAPYRSYLRSPAFLGPVAAALGILTIVVISRLHYFKVIFYSRIETKGGSENAHTHVYSFIPAVLHMHPLLGLGLNNFSVYYQQVTGQTNWGPHSFYVSLIVETGLIGALLFGVFLIWVFMRLRAARALGRVLTAAGDPLGRRVRPLAWGWTAAVVGTMASNAFYLTMTFLYFYAMLVLALTVPIVFARTPEELAGAELTPP
jgi:O-Antigen ligase